MSTQKVKVNIDCPHCSAGNTREANNYHSVIHGEFFHVNDIIDFEYVKKKIDNNEYPYHILSDLSAYIKPFKCIICEGRVKLVNEYNRYNKINATHPFKIKKAGNILPTAVVNKFFKYLEAKERGIGRDTPRTKGESGYDIHIKCEKEVFTDRVWNLIKKDIIKKPFAVMVDGNLEVVYIGGMQYALGWGDSIKLYCYTLLGKPITIKIDNQSAIDFEYLEFPEDTAKSTMAFIGSM